MHKNASISWTAMRGLVAATCLCGLRPASAADSASAVAQNTARVVKAANAFLATLTTAELAQTVYDYTLPNAETWSNLPGATRNGPALAAYVADASSATFIMSADQEAAALNLAAVALSQGDKGGLVTMQNIRASDDVIEAAQEAGNGGGGGPPGGGSPPGGGGPPGRGRGGGLPGGSGHYHLAIFGTPSTTAPWQLQISGHHLAYNITYNGKYVSATPLFIGTEPPNWDVLTDGTTVVSGTVGGSTEYFVNGVEQSTAPSGTVTGTVAPIEAQRAAAYALTQALQADTARASEALLTESFDDVTMGVASTQNDTNYPFDSATETTELYPTGTTGRGVLYSALSLPEQRLVRQAISAWVRTQRSQVAQTLEAAYFSGTALDGTYVAMSNGQGGTVDFSPNPNALATPLNTQGSYLRIDGPRVWIETVVQEAVEFSSEGWVHYHTIWRDKTADYGGCFSSGASASAC